MLPGRFELVEDGCQAHFVDGILPHMHKLDQQIGPDVLVALEGDGPLRIDNLEERLVEDLEISLRPYMMLRFLNILGELIIGDNTMYGHGVLGILVMGGV
jgi:hypothetical protein